LAERKGGIAEDLGTPGLDVPRWAPGAILGVAAGVYVAIGIFTIGFARTWSDEVTYVAKSWWYVRGLVAPYSAADATWYMPLYFYQLGLIELIFGPSLEVARAASLVLGGLSAVFLFAVVKRLTGNALAASLAVLLYLATPATAYYFATATPFAAVSCVLLLTIWLLMEAQQRPSALKSFIVGVLLAVLFFYRQNMVAAIVVLAPMHVLLTKARRARHAILLLAGGACVCAIVALLFPSKLWLYAIRLPLLTGVLRSLGLLGGNVATILDDTETPLSLGFAPEALLWRDIVGTFLLPYLGTTLLALAMLGLGKRSGPWRVLFPALFVFLTAAHYVGSVGYCRNCIVAYTNYYVGVGAACAGFATALLWRRKMQPWALALVGFALVLNVAAPAVIPKDSALHLFPAAMLRQERTPREAEDMARFAQVIAAATPADKPILVIHDLPSLTYAVFRAGRIVQTQSLNIWQSYRDLRTGLSGAERVRVTAALEQESLWSEDSLARWIERDADVIVYQEAVPAGATQEALARYFDLKARADYRGWKVAIYVRKATAAGEGAVDGHALVCELSFVRPGMVPCRPD
jgi:uncharacterized membrane protein